MILYQTAVYKAIYIGAPAEWDVEPEAMFESPVTDNPTVAVKHFDFYEPEHPNWFVTMKTIDSGEVIDEEWFDCSVVNIS